MAIPTTELVFEGPVNNVNYCKYAGSLAINLLDLVYLDPTAYTVNPATSQSDGGSNAINQRSFAKNFLGLSKAEVLSTSAASTAFPVVTDCVLLANCASQTWNLGDKVGISPNSGNNGLLNDTVALVTDPDLAIGEVIKPEASAVTKVLVRLKSNVLPHGRPNLELAKLVEAIAVANFTDGGSTSGYIDLTGKLPAGALVIGWDFNCTGAFKADTSATIEVGTSSSATAFSAKTTESVFAAGKVGSASVAATSFVDSAVSPRVTVTGGADFTSIKTDGTGAGTLTVYYIPTQP